MNYFDSVIRAGYYDAFKLRGIDHTYAILDHNGELWAFPCFGSVALREGHFGNTSVRYPADLWTPYMIGSRNLGTTLAANLHVALGMAQFRPNPTYNFRLSEWEAYWNSGAIDGAASWAGIVYGVSGVCQQACNRVLWSTRMDGFTESAVNWPPSFSSTYWVYGYFGKTSELIALALASGLAAEARSRPMSTMLMSLGDMIATPAAHPITHSLTQASGELSTGVGMDRDTRIAVGQAVRQSLDKKDSTAERRGEVVEMEVQAPSGEQVVESAALVSGILGPDMKFTTVKQELDKQLLRGEIRHEEYAAQVNAAFSRMITEFRNVLPASTFEALFPEGDTVNLIVPGLMPASYEVFQETACV
jgi:hypothetical protein